MLIVNRGLYFRTGLGSMYRPDRLGLKGLSLLGCHIELDEKELIRMVLHHTEYVYKRNIF